MFWHYKGTATRDSEHKEMYPEDVLQIQYGLQGKLRGVLVLYIRMSPLV